MHGAVTIDDSYEPTIELGEDFSDPDTITLFLTAVPHRQWARIFHERATAMFGKSNLYAPALEREAIVVMATDDTKLRTTLDGLRIVLDETNQQWNPIGEELRQRNAKAEAAIRDCFSGPRTPQ